MKGLSPRGRGKRERLLQRAAAEGSIPAWAGETLSIGAGLAGMAVYPRVGGGNICAISGGVNTKGLSPRGRGKRGFAVG